MTNILVAGGAGYIGAHTCLELFNKGFTPITYDNLSNGHAEFVKWGPLEIGDIRDRNKLDGVLGKYKPLAIIHFAAAIEVGESFRDPSGYYDNNVAGTKRCFEQRRPQPLTSSFSLPHARHTAFHHRYRWMKLTLKRQSIPTVEASLSSSKY
jgi:UDP-glucose 4-epimerase